MDRSWVQSYEAVDFDLPVPIPEQQRMLQDGPRSPTRPPSSPLNPALAAPPPPNGPASPFARPLSRGSSAYINRIASEESRAFASLSPSLNTSGSRGSMILYRRADVGEDGALAPPPARSHLNRNSVYSTSGDSIVSLSSDSKYPAFTQERGLIAYAWDPTLDDDGGPVTPEDILHDPREKSPKSAILSMRGFLNIGVLILLILAILALFVVYPAIKTVSDTGVDQLITFNTRINATGQAVDRRDLQAFLARPVDPASPAHPQLLLSDEFSAASDLWQPRPPPSRNGHLVLVPTQPLALSTFLCAPAQGHVEIGLSRRRTLVYNWDAEPNTIALTLVFVFPALVESNIDYIRVYGQQPQDCPMAEPRTLQIDVAS